mmetsp:Transcript_2405/g.6390  ORF Transcript_2405/g.6390 Transcript_2405/m.6390 type:complete len:222 (+) Transcript_2405:319-984(+)
MLHCRGHCGWKAALDARSRHHSDEQPPQTNPDTQHNVGFHQCNIRNAVNVGDNWNARFLCCVPFFFSFFSNGNPGPVRVIVGQILHRRNRVLQQADAVPAGQLRIARGACHPKAGCASPEPAVQGGVVAQPVQPARRLHHPHGLPPRVLGIAAGAAGERCDRAMHRRLGPHPAARGMLDDDAQLASHHDATPTRQAPAAGHGLLRQHAVLLHIISAALQVD